MTVQTQLNVTLWWLTQVRRSKGGDERHCTPCQNVWGCIPLSPSLTPLLVTLTTSLKTSLRNTGWRRHTPKINLSLSKSEISSDWLYHSIFRFSKKLMVSVGVSWSGKTDVFFIDPQKTKVDQNCYIDLLKTSLLCECRWLCPGNDFVSMQDTVRKSDATVYMTDFTNTPDFIAADEWALYSPDLNSLDYCIWDILQDLMYEGRRHPFANLQNLKEAVKTNGRSPVRKSIAQWKNDWMWLESRMEARFSTYFANRCEWISISCSETCWIGYFVHFGHPILFCVFHRQNKSV